MLRAVEHLPHRPLLDDAPKIHHGDRVAEMADHAEIVRHEQERETAPGAQTVQEAKDLGLHRNVQGGDRFVGD